MSFYLMAGHVPALVARAGLVLIKATLCHRRRGLPCGLPPFQELFRTYLFQDDGDVNLISCLDE